MVHKFTICKGYISQAKQKLFRFIDQLSLHFAFSK